MRVIIAGSREYRNFCGLLLILQRSGFEDRITEVVSGGCRGVDMLGEKWARLHNTPVRRFPADWKKHGKAAGPIRNEAMAKYADALVAIKRKDSRGTADMVERAKKHGLKLYVFEYTPKTADEELAEYLAMGDTTRAARGGEEAR